MEDAYIINGGKRLKGEVYLSGAKNVALKIMIASLLFEEKVTLENIPQINDVKELINLINSLGAKAKFIEKNTLEIDPTGLNKNKVDLLYASKIRVSFMVFAPLLYKFGECFVPNPGGCRIGARPIDRVIEGMRTLGVKVEYNHNTGYYQAKMTEKPSGYYRFSKPTHTGTELLIMLSVFSKNQVILENCAVEPEIDDLINFLNQSGAEILKENSKIIIKGVKKLRFKKPYKIINDRNEAVTFIAMGIGTGGEITIKNIDFTLIKTFVENLKKANVLIKNKDKEIHFKFNEKILPVSIETSPHPGFMTDWQPNWAVLMTQAQGESTITERVFENRFSYVKELKKLGAKIDFIENKVDNPFDYYYFNYEKDKKYFQKIKIFGPTKLHGGVLNIADLRAGASLAVASLIAEGESIINNVSILERGYENFVEKVKKIGADIKKV